MRVFVSVGVILALAAVNWETVAASTGEGTALDLAELSIEELMEVEIEITSVAKKPRGTSTPLARSTSTALSNSTSGWRGRPPGTSRSSSLDRTYSMTSTPSSGRR